MSFHVLILEGRPCRGLQSTDSAVHIGVLDPSADALSGLSSLIECSHVVAGNYAADVFQKEMLGYSSCERVDGYQPQQFSSVRPGASGDLVKGTA